MIKSQPILRCILRGVPVIAVAVLLSAYSTDNTAKNMHPEACAVGSETSSLQASQDGSENLVRNVNVKSRVMDQYTDWKGVCYRLDDSTKKGIGCSGFVQHTLREQFGLELPCSTCKQQEMGKSASRSDLRADDLVLLCAGSTGRHVGIYISNNQFIHASTSSGVIIPSINEPCWKKHYNEARRILSRS